MWKWSRGRSSFLVFIIFNVFFLRLDCSLVIQTSKKETIRKLKLKVVYEIPA